MISGYKLILDFDDVLFNAKGLKQVMWRVMEQHGIENGEELYEMERKSSPIFLPKQFLQKSLQDDGEEGDTIMKVDVDSIYNEIISECPRLINQDVLTLLKSVGKENAYIVSNGDQAFQMDKIKSAGMDQLIAKAIIVSGSKKLAVELICQENPNYKIIFLDDKAEYFKDLDRELCQNLETVVYNDETDVTELKREIKESGNMKQEPYQEFSSQGMH